MTEELIRELFDKILDDSKERKIMQLIIMDKTPEEIVEEYIKKEKKEGKK